MTVPEKAKQRLDEASREIKEAVDSLKQEVEELRKKVKERLKGSGKEARESAEELTREVKNLSDRVKQLIPAKRRRLRTPARVERSPGYLPDLRLVELRRAMDDFFDGFFRGTRWPESAWPHPATSMSTFEIGMPRIDMSQTEDELEITAELPGVKKEDIGVSVSGDRVTIHGERNKQEEEKGRDYYLIERYAGRFQRSLPLPFEVDPEKVEAQFKDGVLTLKLPRSAAARERLKKVPIHTG